MSKKAYVNVIRCEKHVLVACCDSELLGKTLRDGEISFEVRESFYGGELVNLDEAIAALRGASTANLVGSAIVSAAIDEGIVHSEAVVLIDKIPHAQIVRF